MTTRKTPIRAQATSEDQSVTTLELFFDLVFVFALTQITALMAHELSWSGVIRGVLLIGLLWWSWIGFSWVCNLVKADEGSVRGVMLAAMGAMFVIALAIPEAFHDLPGGLPGPVVIAIAYFVFRAMHLWLFWLIADGDKVLRRTLARFAPSMVAGTALLLVASQFHGTTQTLIWGAALAADYGGTYLVDARGWRLRSAAHFAERHGLIVIIALGESIVAIGVGVTDLPISWPILVASVLGLAVAAVLWWIYFDATVHYGEQALASEPAETRPKLARDAYTFLHFPMVAGIVLLALGLKKVLEYVGDTKHHHLEDPLKGIGLYALFFGIVLYLLGHVGFKWRTTHRLGISRLITAALCVIAVPLLGHAPALAQLAVLAALLTGLVAFESVRFSKEREALRHSDHA
ncbi:low temperature requirement protein A [Streptomyces sp. SID13031]|uniref:low temperature requirement protein A n=1 Tax=Streptomyces sp. SID13031 TaxID=2706046 RepID=UPI0013CD4D07|nr:low temperature requirement protein A [Streptomyces sp. SID13031]NEA33644.1 low temperature requirement protein A [Streptomyces sp. SID13031]